MKHKAQSNPSSYRPFFFNPKEKLRGLKIQIEAIEHENNNLTLSPAEAIKSLALEFLSTNVEKGIAFARAARLLESAVFNSAGLLYANCRTFNEMKSVTAVLPEAYLLPIQCNADKDHFKWKKYYKKHGFRALKNGKLLTGLRFIEEALKIDKGILQEKVFLSSHNSLNLKGRRIRFYCISTDREDAVFSEAIKQAHDFCVRKTKRWTYLMMIVDKNDNILENYRYTPIDNYFEEHDDFLFGEVSDYIRMITMLGLEALVRKEIHDNQDVLCQVIQAALYYDQKEILRNALNSWKMTVESEFNPSRLMIRAIALDSVQCVAFLNELGADSNPLSYINSLALLGEAVFFANTSLVEYLLQTGQRLNDSDEDGCSVYTSVIELASFFKNGDLNAMYFQILENFVKYHGINERIVQEGNTVLMMAVKSNSLKVVNWCLDRGADPNITNSAGETALMIASNHIILRKLLEHGANIHIISHAKKTALMIALDMKRVKIAKILLGHGANPNDRYKSGKTLLMSCIQKGLYILGHHIKFRSKKDPLGCIKVLLKYGAKIDAKTSKGKTVLIFAVRYQNDEAVSLLLDQHADPNLQDIKGYTALHYACEMGWTEGTLLLLKHGALVNKRNHKGKTPLMVAVKASGLKIIEVLALLIEHDANINLPDEEGRTPLMISIIQCKFYLTLFLIENNAALDRKDCYGWTALMMAVSQGLELVVYLLIKHHVDINLLNKSGLSALMMAVGRENKSIVRSLLVAGAKTETCVYHTALMHSAIDSRLVENLKLLLAYGAKINQQSTFGKSALMIASANNNYSAVEYLVSKGADIDLCDNHGMNAIDIAKRGNFQRIERHLLAHQKKHSSLIPQPDNSQEEDAKKPENTLSNAKNLQDSAVDAELKELLLKFGLHEYITDNHNRTLLMIASLKGYEDLVKKLLDVCDDSINKADKNGYTALMYASENNHLNIVKLLLQAKAYAQRKNKKGQTAFSLALFKCHLDIVNYFMNNESKPYWISTNELSVLMTLIQSKNERVIEFLKSLDFDINYQLLDGRSLLMIASRFGNLEFVSHLCDRGALIDLRDDDQMTALLYAITNGHLDIVKYLINQGADVNCKDHHGWGTLKFAALFEYREILALLFVKGAVFSAKDKELTSPEMIALIEEEQEKCNESLLMTADPAKIEVKVSSISDDERDDDNPSGEIFESEQSTTYSSPSYSSDFETTQESWELVLEDDLEDTVPSSQMRLA